MASFCRKNTGRIPPELFYPELNLLPLALSGGVKQI
jgi:hypothetical protein